MAITLNEPAPVAPTPADTLDRLYVVAFEVQSDAPGRPVSAHASLAPYSSATGRVGSRRVTFTDADYATLAARRPDAEAAVAQVLDQLPAIRAAAPAATLALLELVAQALGAVAQLPAEPTP